MNHSVAHGVLSEWELGLESLTLCRRSSLPTSPTHKGSSRDLPPPQAGCHHLLRFSSLSLSNDCDWTGQMGPPCVVSCAMRQWSDCQSLCQCCSLNTGRLCWGSAVLLVVFIAAPVLSLESNPHGWICRRTFITKRSVTFTRVVFAFTFIQCFYRRTL